jgi:hypothetical protein
MMSERRIASRRRQKAFCSDRHVRHDADKQVKTDSRAFMAAKAKQWISVRVISK